MIIVGMKGLTYQTFEVKQCI